MKKENGVLKAHLAIEQNKVKKAEKDKQEMTRKYEEMKGRAEDREVMIGLLNEYLDNVEQVFTCKGKDLTGEYLYQQYFSSCTGIPEIEQVVRIAEEYGMRFEDMLQDAVKVAGQLQDFRAELQCYAPAGEQSPVGVDEYRMTDPEYRMEDPEIQKSEPDHRMEEIPDTRTEEKPEAKPEEKPEEEEKEKEKEEEEKQKEEKKEEEEADLPMTEEDWERILKRGPSGASFQKLRTLLARQEVEERQSGPASASQEVVLPVAPEVEERPKVVTEEYCDILD